MKRYLLLISIGIEFCGFFASAHAQVSPSLVVTPVVIDEKVKPRDIVKESVMVKNNSNYMLEIYPSVSDINSQLGDQGFSRAADSTGLADSLANWIELSRGAVDLGPGEEKAIPFIIRVNLNAVPSTYHAQIAFTTGGTRAEADAKPPIGVVTVNVEVQADIKELLQLNKFTTDNVYFSGDDVMFNYQLQNIGNQNLEPKGQVHIYNRNGEEVATVDVNREGKTVSPDQVAQMASVWSGANGFGRYKALLTVDYGSSQIATVQDTVFFWVVPWKQMLLLFTISLLIIVFLALQFHNWLERRHLYKFAHAGLLNEDTIQKLHGTEEFVPTLPATPEQRPLVASAVAAVVEAPQVTKRRFGMFRRGQRSTVSEEKAMTQSADPVESKHRSLKEVLAKQDVPKVQGSAIDLKQLRTQARIQPSDPTVSVGPTVHNTPTTTAQVQGHVISLKKSR